MLYQHQIQCKFVPNSTKFGTTVKFMQIRCQKGIGTKMHKFLVGLLNFEKTYNDLHQSGDRVVFLFQFYSPISFTRTICQILSQHENRGGLDGHLGTLQLKPELIFKIYQKIVLYSLLIRNFSKFTYVMKTHLKKLP